MMKIWNTVLIAVCFFFLGLGTPVFADEVSEAERVLAEYCETVNCSDINNYINLFTEDHQIQMKEYLKIYPDASFFQEEGIAVEGVIELSDQALMECTNVSEDALNMYKEYKAYYVEILGDLKYDSDNHTFKVFVIVKENDEWKILNILTPNINQLYEQGVAFSSKAEEEEMDRQAYALAKGTDDFPIEKSVVATSTPWYTAPQAITVYFTKNENIQHYGKATASIDFHEYIKNVVPEEWIVSYYGQYPTYLQAGVMACKMFGWYHTVYPAYQFAPYYADVKDNGDSQNFLYNSYSKMLKKYQGYLTSAMSFAQNLVMVTEKTNELFLVQYRSNSGSIHSGYLNQAAALELAKQGVSAVEILNTYLGSTPFTKGQMIKLMACGES